MLALLKNSIYKKGFTMIKYDDVKQTLKTKFQAENKQSSPFTKNSFLGAILNTIAGGFYDFYKKLEWVQRQSFAHTAEHKYLKIQAQNRIEELPSRKALGSLSVFGDVGTSIAKGTQFQTLNTGYLFNSLEVGIISKGVIDIIEISSINGEVIVNTTEVHSLVTGCEITIANAETSEFNGVFKIEVINDVSFTFDILQGLTLTEPLFGSSIEVSVNMASIIIESDKVGTAYNLDVMTELNPTLSITGLTLAKVPFYGLSGGRNEESEEDYRLRYLEYLRNPQAYFSDNFLKNKILVEFGKVTRAFPKNHTPTLNNITIYVFDDNIDGYKVDNDTLIEVKESILDIAPINILSDGVIVENPKQQNVIFSVTSINPSTDGLKEAVRADITEYILSLGVGALIKVDDIRSIIYNAYDTSNSNRVLSFELNMIEDITLDADSIGVWVGEVE